MAEPAIAVSGVPRLHGSSNYAAWRIRMRAKLRATGYWLAVAPPEDEDEDAAPVPEVTTQKALDLILHHVDDTVLSIIQEANTAQEAWATLESNYTAATQARRLQLQHELMTLKKHKDEGIQAFISRAKNLAADIRLADGDISDDMLVLCVSNALFKTDLADVMSMAKINAQGNGTSLTLETITTIMLSAEAEPSRRQRRYASEGVAMSARPEFSYPPAPSMRNRSDGRPSSKGPCHFCKAMGHFKRECRKYAKHLEQLRNGNRNNSGSGTSGGPSSSAAGANAGGRPSSSFSRPTSRAPDAQANVTTAVAFGASSASPLDVAAYLLDSGASQHIVYDFDLLYDFVLFDEPRRVYFGNGTSLPAFGYGKVSFSPSCKYHSITLRDVWFVPDAAYNFISVPKATAAGITVVMMEDCAELLVRGEVIATADKGPDNLYFLYPFTGYSPCSPTYSLLTTNSSEVTDASTAQVSLSCAAAEATSALKMEAAEPSALGPAAAAAAAAAARTETAQLWHQRYGHTGYSSLARLVSDDMVSGISVSAADFKAAGSDPCEPCFMSKNTKNFAHPWPSSSPPVTGPGVLLHTDLMGKITPSSISGSQYAVTVLDEYSRYSEVHFVRKKSQASDVIKDVIQRWETQLGSRVKAVRSDRGGEYIGSALQDFFAEKGIQHQLTAPYSPEQNGKAERLNRTLQERARSMLYESGLNGELWAEALNTASYLRNLAPVSGLAKTPWELFHGVQPDVSHLRTFGCLAYPLIETKFRDGKFAPVSYKGYMVGYERNSKAYRIFVPTFRSDRLVISKNVQFDERKFQGKRIFEDAFGLDDGSDSESGMSSQQVQRQTQFVIYAEPSTLSPSPLAGPAAQPNIHTGGIAGGNSPHNSSDSESGGDGDPTVPLPPAPDPPAPAGLRRSERTRRPPSGWWQAQPGSGSASANAAVPASSAAAAVTIPDTLEQAYASPQSQFWKQAVREEMEALYAFKTWELEKLPYGRKAIPCKWVFTVKQDAHGNIVRFKARLVAKGFAQREGIDFTEVFAPVSKYTSLRALLSAVAALDLELRQIDVKTAFLNGYLDEEIFMKQPPGFHEGGPDIVCKLHRSLYGLKQAPRAWYARLTEEVGKLGFKASDADPALFILDDGGVTVYLLVYVDDCLIAAPQGNTAVLDRIIAALQSVFDLKDMGEASTFLGIDINRDRSGNTLTLGQPRYVTDLLAKYNMLEARPRSVPLCPSTRLQRDGRPLDRDRFNYSELIGSLLYLSICTRPDIAHAVGALARYMAAPTVEHWTAALSILRYLHGTRDYRLTFSGDSGLVGYCDSDYAGDVDTRRSTTGFTFLLNGGVISWSSKLQPTVATSTCEAEYIAAAAATKEALWLRKLLSVFGITTSPVLIYSDNQGALSIIKNPVTSARSKHIDVAYHFVRERAARREVDFKYCATDLQVADIFTKALPSSKFHTCRRSLGLK